MTSYQIPVGKQRDFCLHSDAGVNLAHGAIRSAKTVGVNTRWLKAIHEADENTNLLMVGKTLGALERNVLVPLARMVGPSNFLYKRSLKRVWIYGRECWCEGANDASAYQKIEGETLQKAYVDEGSLCHQSFWDMLITRLSEDGSELFATSNPGPPTHYLKKRWIDREGEIDLKSWHFTLDDNPWISDAYKEELKRRYAPETSMFYQRFIKGLWVSDEGAVFKNFDPSIHCIPALPDGRLDELRVAVDVGATHPSGFLKAYRIGQDWYVAGEYRKADKTPVALSQDLKRFVGGQFASSIDVDPSAKSHRLQFMADGISPITPADNDVLNSIQRIINALEMGWLHFVGPATPMLQEEMTAYRWDDRATERGEDKPIKENDDLIDCLRYLVNRIAKSRRGVETRRSGS